MESNRRLNARGGALTVLMTCLVYFLLDFPIRFTGAYHLPGWLGIKSFLPFTCGLFFGPLGALGSALGAVLAGLLCQAETAVILTEILCILLTGLGCWLCWFAVYRDGHVRFERYRELGVYAALVLGLSLLCGGVSAALLGREMFLPTAGIFALTGLLVGLPVNILLGGIFCVTPVLPRYSREEGGISFLLTPRDAASETVNEAIEEEALPKKIPMKRVFEIENCLEELYIRIRRKLPEAEVYGKVELGSTISLRIWVTGAKYNPFLKEPDEDEMDLISLKLLRHRALRASYSYTGGQNQIRIVV